MTVSDAAGVDFMMRRTIDRACCTVPSGPSVPVGFGDGRRPDHRSFPEGETYSVVEGERGAAGGRGSTHRRAMQTISVLMGFTGWSMDVRERDSAPGLQSGYRDVWRSVRRMGKGGRFIAIANDRR